MLLLQYEATVSKIMDLVAASGISTPSVHVR